MLKQPFFNGKEFDRMHGLDTYDYGARQYDGAKIVWDRMDPLCEKKPWNNPYVFCSANPVNRIDPDGNDDYYTPNGKFLFTDISRTDNIYIINSVKYYVKDNITYAIFKNKQLLTDADLTAETYSKIFTDIASKTTGVDVEKLCDDKVQVTVWTQENGSKSSEEYTENAGFAGDALATTEKDHSKEALITVYIWPKGTEERALFSTRSNIQSCLGHEYNGHFIKGYRHINNQFDPTYKLEKSNPVWKKTTKAYKDYINKVIKQNGYK